MPAVDADLGLMSTISLERRLGSSSHWSYFFSAAANFIVILPGASLQDLAATATVAPADTVALIRYWLTSSSSAGRSATQRAPPTGPRL